LHENKKYTTVFENKKQARKKSADIRNDGYSLETSQIKVRFGATIVVPMHTVISWCILSTLHTSTNTSEEYAASFCREDGGSMTFRNVGTDYKIAQCRNP
jgi:hypothetical protein